jgi:2'-phosphotransferase
MIENKATIEEIKSVVDNNDKKRYQLISEIDSITGIESLWIRAVQGHTIETVHDEELLKPILDPF